MKILFSNNETVDLLIDDTPIGNLYKKIYHHLSRIPIPFSPWDNPYYRTTITYNECVDVLITHANNLSIDINKERCLAHDQLYFNQIHTIYEQNYNGDPRWLKFHENLHLCEDYVNQDYWKALKIDYREKMGPLEKPFDQNWLTSAVTKIKTGDVYVTCSELGKSPYAYWEDNEDYNIERLCQLGKPWLKFRPKIFVAVADMDRMKNVKLDEFNTWWSDYKEPWLKHWRLPDWTVEDMFGVNVYGRVTQIDLLTSLLKNNITPTRILI